jgi:stage II sporulation protein AA (anti-sigma F factor antagonist)
MQDEVKITESGSDLIAALTCELDHHTSRRVREIIDKQVFATRPEMLVLDFSAVHFMDSSGIALIIGRVEVARAVGATVRVTGLSPTLRRLVRLSGLEKIRELVISA